MSTKIFHIIVLLFWLNNVSAQDRYIAYFTDKAKNEFSINRPEEFLSAKSISRRALFNIDLDETDLPVSLNYIKEVRDLGIEVFHKSKWLNCILIEATAEEIESLSNLNFVEMVDYAAPGNPLSGGRTENINEKLDLETVKNVTQNDLIGSSQFSEIDINGEGVDIAVIDAGFLGFNTDEAFSDLHQNNRVVDIYDFVGNESDVYKYHSHGTNVISTIAAEIPGEYSGIATGANYYLYISEDVTSEYRIEEYNWLFAAEKADSAGVDIITTSLGYYDFDDPLMNYTHADLDGNTAIITKAADLAASKGIATIFSSGNQANKPWGKITFPSDCFDCIVVGSVNAQKRVSVFSSGGPTADGRIKPDIVAQGEGAAVVEPNGSISYKNGTSLSAPQIAGLMAGLLQIFPNMNSREIYSHLKSTADNAESPDNLRGWGIPHFRSVVNSIYSINQTENVALFPNPTRSTLNIQVLDPIIVSQLNYVITDRIGKVVKKGIIDFSFASQRKPLDINDLSSGLYVIKLTGKSTSVARRILKE